MIDTLKLLIPVNDSALLQQMEGTLMRFQKKDLKTGEVEFEFFSTNLKLGSYQRNVAIKSTSNPKGLFVECSFAKYAKGNNVEMIYPHDLMSIAEKLYTELCKHVGHTLPPISTWEVYRLDICYNWLFKNKDEAVYAIDFINRIDYPRKKKHVWDTSVMHQGSAYVVKFYLKGPEFEKHDRKEIEKKDSNRAYELKLWANNIVRFEVGLKHRYLCELYGLKKVYLTDIDSDYQIEDTLKHFLSKVFYYINNKTTTSAEVRRILSENFSKTKAMRLYQFYMGYYFDEEIKAMYLHGGLNRTTIYRYKKDLQRVGVGFVLSDKNNGAGIGILEQLVIPSTKTRFALFDVPDTIRP
jgi:II/X family phage/plasmid replication protein